MREAPRSNRGKSPTFLPFNCPQLSLPGIEKCFLFAVCEWGICEAGSADGGGGGEVVKRSGGRDRGVVHFFN
jgi:hypothetical protein